MMLDAGISVGAQSHACAAKSGSQGSCYIPKWCRMHKRRN
jgi:hypothetical protein